MDVSVISLVGFILTLQFGLHLAIMKSDSGMFFRCDYLNMSYFICKIKFFITYNIKIFRDEDLTVTNNETTLKKKRFVTFSNEDEDIKV